MTVDLERLAALAAPEICDECGEIVRYWNSDDGRLGNASCACCAEGPESCDPVDPDTIVRQALPELLRLARIGQTLLGPAREMRRTHEGCVTTPDCGACVRCDFDAAVDACDRLAKDQP